MKTIKDVEISGKRILLRADLDVSLRFAQGKPPQVEEDFRLKAQISQIRYLVDQGAKVIILGHLGRPTGRDKSLSLKPVAERLGELLGRRVSFIDDCIGARVKSAVSDLSDGEVLVLENLRFYPGEEGNEEGFARELSASGDLYVNNAFATSHRAHASIVGIPKFLPAYGGFALEKEVETLGQILKSPEHPLVAIIGGAKVETKAPAALSLSRVADEILLGGVLMFAQGLEGIPGVIFPVDTLDIYDIGERTTAIFEEKVLGAKTIVWNGPLGKFEDPRYERGTRKIAQAIASSGAFSVVGGGDTIAALAKFGLLEKMGFVSLGGGAMLDFISGKKLPGLEALGYYS